MTPDCWRSRPGSRRGWRKNLRRLSTK